MTVAIPTEKTRRIYEIFEMAECIHCERSCGIVPTRSVKTESTTGHTITDVRPLYYAQNATGTASSHDRRSSPRSDMSMAAIRWFPGSRATYELELLDRADEQRDPDLSLQARTGECQ